MSEQEKRIHGSFVIRCVKEGGYTMTGYGQYVWAEDEEHDLVSNDTLPESLQCIDYYEAHHLCRYPRNELAIAIDHGDFIIVSRQFPD